jgi:hypothetical protein
MEHVVFRHQENVATTWIISSAQMQVVYGKIRTFRVQTMIWDFRLAVFNAVYVLIFCIHLFRIPVVKTVDVYRRVALPTQLWVIYVIRRFQWVAV